MSTGVILFLVPLWAAALFLQTGPPWVVFIKRLTLTAIAATGFTVGAFHQ